MKLGFWTLGMPAWPAERFAQIAAELGFDGVELGASRRQPVAEGFEIPLDASGAEIQQVRSAFATAGVEIPTLLGYNAKIHVDGKPDWSRYEEDIARHTPLAEGLGVKRIRVGVDAPADPADWDSTLDRAWVAIAAALNTSPGLGAIIENHPGNASAGQLLAAAERAQDPRIGVVYSPDHCLTMQEDVLGLVDSYAPWIHEVCLADRRLVQEGLADFDGRYYTIRYESCVVGDGNVPIAALIDRLDANGFNDYVSLKWEKSSRYGQHLPEGDTVLPGFAELLASLPQFSNKQRTQ